MNCNCMAQLLRHLWNLNMDCALLFIIIQYVVVPSGPTLCNTMDCSTPGFPVLIILCTLLLFIIIIVYLNLK